MISKLDASSPSATSNSLLRLDLQLRAIVLLGHIYCKLESKWISSLSLAEDLFQQRPFVV